MQEEELRAIANKISLEKKEKNEKQLERQMRDQFFKQ